MSFFGIGSCSGIGRRVFLEGERSWFGVTLVGLGNWIRREVVEEDDNAEG